MRSNVFVSFLIASAACVATVMGSPIEPIQREDAHAVARSMMGSTNNLVSWESMQLERSPADPELVELDKRIVYNPPITSPNAQSVWHAGQQETVRWTVDQSQIPDNANNYLVTIMLGYIKKDGSGGENLKWTLAKDIPITDEEAEIKVPTNLTAHSNFIVVVMGDSGNASPKFTIKTTDVQTNEAAKCSNTPDTASDYTAPSNAVSDKSATIKDASGVVSAREMKEQDKFAANMLGRDVQKAS